MNVEQQGLLLVKEYKCILSNANNVDQPSAAESKLKDKPSSNLDDLNTYRSVLANEKIVSGLNLSTYYNDNLRVEE